MKIYWLAVSITCAAIAAPPQAARAVDCGDVITGPVSVRLDRDLSCGGATAVTVRDGATLNLGRYTVRCTGGGVGIALGGTGARVLGGEVTRCAVGVALTGKDHVVDDVRARFNGLGFDAAGSGFRLRDNHAEFNGSEGFRVVGAGNRITGNVVFGNDTVAVSLQGDRNVLSGNRVNGNCNDCPPTDCPGALVVGGTGNQVARNLATGERTGVALLSGASATVVTRNRVRHGLVGGILVELGATGNVLRGNEVRSLGTDLVDANGSCAANTWTGNTFSTRSPGCLE